MFLFSSEHTNMSNSRCSYTYPPLFARIKRFLVSKYGTRKYQPPRLHQVVSNSKVEVHDLSDDSVVLQRSVKKLHFGNCKEKETAVIEIERLARQDMKRKKLMAELGVIPVLVSMAASMDQVHRSAAVKALVELANGNYRNKTLIIKAGLLSKLPENVSTIDESTRHDFADLLLSLSSLPSAQFLLAPSEILLFVISILESSSSIESKQSCLGVLHKLSGVLENANIFASNKVIHILLTLASVRQLSERALATISNLVVTVMGKNAMENNSQMVPGNLIEILTWDDKPKCQELSLYILMVLAHKGSSQRDKMVKSGIVSVLLELSLLGSPLAQKRSLRLLQWFKDEGQVKLNHHSGPQIERIATFGSPANKRYGCEGKKLMKSLVKQSLNQNMEIITQRANVVGESSNFKGLVLSTSSKSLPY